MQVPQHIKDTLLDALDDAEVEFQSRIDAFRDYSDEDIASRNAEFAEARAWLEAN